MFGFVLAFLVLVLVFFLMGIYSLAVKINLWFELMKHTYERAGVAG